MNHPEQKKILVTGATGYVGGRLIPLLADEGYHVRAFGRSMEKMACRSWSSHPNVELAQGDVLDRASVHQAAQGCWAAFYLVHSMIAQKDRYADADRRSAHNMRWAATRAGLQRVIYLGGLGDQNHPAISMHLASRHEVGRILQAGDVPTTVLNAAMILGSGSASFEILRYLVERLPVMITPRWVRMPTQPIAIGNVLAYLTGCLRSRETIGQTFDIGGPDVLTYRDLIRIFAEEAGLAQRRIIPVPVLSPGLSAKWIHLVTPVPAEIAKPLTDGLSLPTICKDQRIKNLVPQPLLSCREAIRTALAKILEEQVETCWSDAGSLKPPEWAVCGDADWAGGTVLECGYRTRLQASEEAVWQLITRMGGRTGYYFGNKLWKLRGMLDRWAGGIGLRRGRRHPTELRTGDALDFWRVMTATPPSRLTLLAEMRIPGEAVLDIQVREVGDGATELQMLSRFLPRGLAGLTYWYALYPIHQWIFSGMLREIARAIGKPLITPPQRFTPAIANACRLPTQRHRR